MHLDAVRIGIESCQMVESQEIEIAIELAIDARQKIQVERRGEAERIVVRVDHERDRLLQVGSQQQIIARLQDLANVANEGHIRGGTEIPYSAAQKKDEDSLTRLAACGHLQQSVQIAAFESHNPDRFDI